MYKVFLAYNNKHCCQIQEMKLYKPHKETETALTMVAEFEISARFSSSKMQNAWGKLTAG